MATIEGTVQASHRRLGVGWALGSLAAVAVAAVAVAALAVLSQAPTRTPVLERRTSEIYTADELAVIRLAEQGVIPAETLDGDLFVTKRLINQGVVPRESLEARSLPVAPLYCPDELALMAAVASGAVPPEALEGNVMIKRLINQGLVPREAAAPCG